MFQIKVDVQLKKDIPMLDQALLSAEDQKLLDEFSFELDRIERQVPMRGSYSRIDPYILECQQAGIRFKFIVYHVESQLWFDNQDRPDGALTIVRECALVNTGDTVFDLGCNSGFLTTWFALRVGPAGRVLAFDPFPWNTLATSYSARLNGSHNVECHTVGIANAERTVRLPIMDSKSYENTAVARQDTFESRLLPLDQFASHKPRFIKVDIEGAERDLLAGSTQLLQQDPKSFWFLEMHNAFIRNAGSDPDQIARDFMAQGYAPRIHHPRGELFETVGTLPEGCALFAPPNST